jgi:hydroxymethylpyrimidine/phosphomethylpyrimidine kinase
MTPVALTIAGSDPSGGAGLQADLKTFHRFNVYGEAVVTLITVQNTRSVSRVEVLSPALVLEQIAAVLEDVPPDAAKTGALGSAQVVMAVAEIAQEFRFPLVVDPVMISKHGALLLNAEGMRALVETLIPSAYLLMPNLEEASALAEFDVQDTSAMMLAGRKLVSMGAANVLVKGGHLVGDAVDVLCLQDGSVREFRAPRVRSNHTHGSGCTFSAAVTAELAKGTRLVAAVERAKHFITEAIRSAPGLGSGNGPLNHHA